MIERDLDLDRVVVGGSDRDRTRPLDTCTNGAFDFDEGGRRASLPGTGDGGTGNCAPRLDSSANVNVADVLSATDVGGKVWRTADRGGGPAVAVVDVMSIVEMGDGT